VSGCLDFLYWVDKNLRWTVDVGLDSVCLGELTALSTNHLLHLLGVAMPQMQENMSPNFGIQVTRFASNI